MKLNMIAATLDLLCFLFLLGAVLSLNARVDALEAKMVGLQHEVRTHSTTFYMTNTIGGLTQ